MKRTRFGGVCGGLLVLAVALLPLSCSWAYRPPSLEEIASRALQYTASAEKSAVVQGSNTFGLELHGALAQSESGNIFLSPFSISSALAMAYLGARGDTAAHMAETLHFDSAAEELAEAFGALITDMKAVGERDGYELDIASSLWGQQGYPFLAAFLAVLEDSYGAPLREVDFEADLEASRAEINDWVELETRDRILDLLPQGSINDLTRLVLANAITFKGTWARTFDASADFSGIAGTLELSIGDVYHKAFVTVNEEGTEAAAATLSSAFVLPGPGGQPMIRAAQTS